MPNRSCATSTASSIQRSTKQGALASLVIIGLAGGTISATAAEIAPHEQALYDAAREAGETSITWYTAHTSGEVAHEVGRTFEERYPGITVDAVRTTAQVAYQRVTQELMANSLQVDVLSSTDRGHYTALKEQNELLPYRPVNVDGYLDDFKGIDLDDMFHITAGGLAVITYNTELVSPEDVPTSWLDLTDPKWRDQITLGHPGFSGYVGNWVLLMDQLFGWEFFEKVEENNPQIGRSINDTITMLNARERSIGVGASGTTLLSASNGNPLALSYPEEGALLMASPSAIMRQTSHLNAAKLFMEFLTSQTFGNVMTSNFSEALRPDVTPPVGATPLGEVTLLQPENIEEGVPRIIELWRDTFGI